MKKLLATIWLTGINAVIIGKYEGRSVSDVRGGNGDTCTRLGQGNVEHASMRPERFLETVLKGLDVVIAICQE